MKKFYPKIYHITLIMCAPYVVKVNKNSFQLKTLLFFVHLRSQQKRTEKVISNDHIYSCHFDIVILRVAIISNAENVCLQRRHRLTNDASLVDGVVHNVHYRVLVQWTSLIAIASENPPHHACSTSCLKIS